MYRTKNPKKEIVVDEGGRGGGVLDGVRHKENERRLVTRRRANKAKAKQVLLALTNQLFQSPLP